MRAYVYQMLQLSLQIGAIRRRVSVRPGGGLVGVHKIAIRQRERDDLERSLPAFFARDHAYNATTVEGDLALQSCLRDLQAACSTLLGKELHKRRQPQLPKGAAELTHCLGPCSSSKRQIVLMLECLERLCKAC
jgi:hypothetical protein